MNHRGIFAVAVLGFALAGCGGGDPQAAPPPTADTPVPSSAAPRAAAPSSDPPSPGAARDGNAEAATEQQRAARAALRWAWAYSTHSAEPTAWEKRLRKWCTPECMKQLDDVDPARVPFEPVDVIGAQAQKDGETWDVSLDIAGHAPWRVRVVPTPAGLRADHITPPLALEGDRP